MASKLYNQSKHSLSGFKESLEKDGASKLTVKNYVSDVRSFLSWKDKNAYDMPDEEAASIFLKEISGKLSSSSLKRKKSSINRYLSSPRDDSRKIYSPALAFAGVVLVLLISAYSSANNFDVAKVNDDTPVDATNISPVGGNSRQLVNAKGVRIVLSEDYPAPKERDALILKDIANVDLSQVSSIQNNFSAQGSTVIPAGKKSTVIVNDLINETSFISITPKSPTGNQVLYIEDQKDGYMVVSMESQLDTEVRFDWKIDNTEVYYSIL